jgi:hypothetical protein
MPVFVRVIAFLWEYPIMAVTYLAGATLSSNAVSKLKGRVSK